MIVDYDPSATILADTGVQTVLDWARMSGLTAKSLGRLLEGLDTSLRGAVPHLPAGQRPTFYVPGLTAEPVWDVGQFDWARSVQNAWKQILSERDQAEPNATEVRNSRTASGRWSARYIVALGRLDAAAARNFPNTVQALSLAPGGRTCGMAYFSEVSGGTHISAHAGFTNAHLRCHLTLVEAPKCRIRVSEKVLTWRAGELLVFDDSFEHEVWNESTERRLVLLFDIFHPDLTDVEQCALKFLAGQWRNTAMRQAVAKTLVTAGSDA